MRPPARVKEQPCLVPNRETWTSPQARPHDAFVGLEAGLLEMDRVVDLVRDKALLERFSVDEGDAAPVLPEAVVLPQTSREVAAVMQAASRHSIPVTPRGAGTNRVGGAVPCPGGIVMAMENFGASLDIDEASARAHVGPSTITKALHDAAESCGLFYGPDPSSSAECQIGGNIACNAAGPRAFKYGSTSQWVLGLEVVTAEGELLKLGAGTSKGVAGYNLKSLVTGSEGTLAVVCGATLRLIPAAQEVATLLVSLKSERDLSSAILALQKARVQPRCLEFLDRQALQVLSTQAAGTFPAAARSLLLLELDGEDLSPVVERSANVLLDAGVLEVQSARSSDEQARLWQPRRQLSRLLRGLAKHKLSEDVVVPRAQVSPLLSKVRETCERLELRNATYGHAGDGNLHVNFFWDDADEKRRVDVGVRSLFESVTELGGSLSGEHGIGLTKAPYIGLELSEAQLALQRRIKETFDPKNILNPGKIFGSRVGHGSC